MTIPGGTWRFFGNGSSGSQTSISGTQGWDVPNYASSATDNDTSSFVNCVSGDGSFTLRVSSLVCPQLDRDNGGMTLEAAISELASGHRLIRARLFLQDVGQQIGSVHIGGGGISGVNTSVFANANYTGIGSAGNSSPDLGVVNTGAFIASGDSGLNLVGATALAIQALGVSLAAFFTVDFSDSVFSPGETISVDAVGIELTVTGSAKSLLLY